MTEAEAIEALRFHTGSDSGGFLGSLRPYRGNLNLEAMRELEDCLRALAPILQTGESVERDILTDFLAIIGCGQYWALLPDGMLQRNGLIEDEDVGTLTAWIAGFSIAFQMIIEGGDVDSALMMIESISDG